MVAMTECSLGRSGRERVLPVFDLNPPAAAALVVVIIALRQVGDVRGQEPLDSLQFVHDSPPGMCRGPSRGLAEDAKFKGALDDLDRCRGEELPFANGQPTPPRQQVS